MDPMDIVGKSKEDASLPKATMTKIIKEMLPADVRVARDAQDLLIECCVEFINLISSESNEVCNKEDKRTIAPEHQDSQRSVKMNTSAEMTEEEAAAEQQRMFTEDRARMNGGPCLFTCRATCDMRHATDRRSQVVVRFAVA
ncbi:hypothetical protein YC2023_034201 [Brassica napus]